MNNLKNKSSDKQELLKEIWYEYLSEGGSNKDSHDWLYKRVQNADNPEEAKKLVDQVLKIVHLEYNSVNERDIVRSHPDLIDAIFAKKEVQEEEMKKRMMVNSTYYVLDPSVRKTRHVLVP